MPAELSPVYYTGLETGPLCLDFVPDPAGTFVKGDLVVVDVAVGDFDVCGADPALIAGWATGPKTGGFVTAEGKMPVEIIGADVAYVMTAAGTLVATSLGKKFGVVKTAAGKWEVDIADTTATRVVITSILDLAAKRVEVHFLAATLQFNTGS